MRPLTTSFQRLEGQRWLSVVIDCSEAMKDVDMPPNRLIRLLVLLPTFINQYFDTNPLSQMQIIQTSNGLASLVSPMSGNAEGHIRALRDLALSGRSEAKNESDGTQLYEGAMSIQNSLLFALKSQRSLPKYGRREVLMVLGSIASQDPSHPATCLPVAKATRTSISFIHLAGEMYICKRLASETDGLLKVPLNEKELIETLATFASSGPNAVPTTSTDTSTSNTQGRILTMGFPLMDTLDGESGLATDPSTFFKCPRCLHCLPENSSLPTNCPICKLMLAKFQQLARSYAHLFEQPSLRPLELNSPVSCYACSSVIPPTSEIPQHFLPDQNPDPTRPSQFNTPLFSAASTSAASIPFQQSSAQEIPPTLQCYQCKDCDSTFCGVCKDGIVHHLHQCLGCLDKDDPPAHASGVVSMNV